MINTSKHNKADRELDREVVSCLFSVLEDGYDTSSETNEYLFFYHNRGGILIGEPYKTERNPHLHYHQWREFSPSSNMADAWLVINHLEHNGYSPSLVNDSEGNWFLSFFSEKEFGEKVPAVNVICEDKSLWKDRAELAICHAIIDEFRKNK